MGQNIIKTSDITKFWAGVLQLGILLVALYATSFYSYVLFHSLAEIASVVIAVAIFLVAWNSKSFSDNSYYLLIGFGFLAVGIIDLFHTFEYKGVGIIHPGGDTNTATQLWLAGRYLIALSFFTSPFLKARKINLAVVITTFAAIAAFLFLTIFQWEVFPAAYVDGSGLTPFKIISEYIIIALFVFSFIFFYKMRREFHRRVFYLISSVLIIMILTEFSFTLYVGVYDFFNLLGHLLKVAAYYFAYLGIVEFGLMKPYRTLFKDLKDKEVSLRESEERYRSLVELSPEPIVVHSQAKIIYANEGAAEIFGVKSREEIIGKKLVDLFHLGYDDIVSPEIKKVDNGQWTQTASNEMKIMRANGEKIDVEIKGRKIIYEGTPAVESVIHDVTERKKTEQKIGHLASFPQLNPNPVIEVNSKGEVSYFNAAATAVLNQLDTKQDFSMFFPADFSKLLEKLNLSKEDRALYREVNIDGRTFAESILLNPGFGVMRLYVTDITKRKLAEEELKRAADEWSMTFNSISDLIFILDNNHTVIRVNKALCDFLGKTEKEIIGRKCFEFMHKQREPWATCPLKITRQSKKPHTEEIDEPTLGKVLLVTTSPILNDKNEIIGIVHIAKDITERKKIERSKDEFISLASHQLRTPLTNISLASELLLRGAEGNVDPMQKEMLDEIYRSTKRMTALISNMLNVSRIEMGTLAIQPKPMNIGKSAEEIVNELQSQINEKKLILKKEFQSGLPGIKFDEAVFRIILENLLTNAIRYTPRGGTIAVGLAQKSNQLVLSVCDTGCGIPKDDQENIFQKLFRAENAKKISSDGHGLGLYMVKSMAEKTGMKIDFKSQEGQGTEFFVSLPIY